MTIFDQSDVVESEAGTRDPKVVALALLARTMGNFQAGILLWVAALAKTGEAFIQAMELDDAADDNKPVAV